MTAQAVEEEKEEVRLRDSRAEVRAEFGFGDW